MSGKSFSERLGELRAQIEQHPGTVAYRRWHAISRLRGILVLNGEELLSVIDAPNHDKDLAVELFQNQWEPEVRERYVLELYRALHNYVAAVKSLVDHSRNLVRKEADKGFISEYERRKKAVTREPVANFVQDLRNYLLHHSLPPFRTRVSWAGDARDGFDHAVLLAPQDFLNSWKRWSPPAKRYLESSDKELQLREPIQAYEDLVSALYDWMFEEFERLHGDEMQALEQIRTDYNTLLTGGQT